MPRTSPLAALVAIGVALALPLPAGANEPATAVADSKQALAIHLAGILHGEEIIVGGDDQARKFALDLFRGHEEFSKLEAAYPGLLDEFVDGLLPITNRSMRARLPQLHQRQADLYARTFTEADLAFLIRFYESPTGRKLIGLASKNLQTANMAKTASASDDLTITSDAVLADLRSTAKAIAPHFTAADMKSLSELGASPAAAKLHRIAKQTQQIGLDWQNEYLPGEEEEIAALLDTILARRMEAAE